MIFSIRLITVWLTTVMLLLQTVCPVITSGCHCRESGCCREHSAHADLAAQKPRCPHCQKADAKAACLLELTSPACHCRELIPVPQNVEKSKDVTGSLQTVTSYDVSDSGQILVVEGPEIRSSQVVNTVSLVCHYAQIVCCVWLT